MLPDKGNTVSTVRKSSRVVDLYRSCIWSAAMSIEFMVCDVNVSEY